MIHDVSLEGFKSFCNEDIKLSPLTLLTGLNSSGKSSVIQAIRILRNYSQGMYNPLLIGHGGKSELQNSFVKTPFTIKSSYCSGVDEKSIQYDSGANALVPQENDFPKLLYISADRFGPRLSIPITQDEHLGERGENVLKCIEKYRDEILPAFLRHINSQGETLGFNLKAWLTSISPGVKFEHHIQNHTDSSYALFNDHRAINVGFGLSYTLPVIAALLLGPITQQVVLIENPEAHLHPKGQAELARLICLSVMAGSQVIVETHSDHLFDGVRVFAKENNGFAKNVAIHWFELDGNNNTIIESPKLDDNGRINKWPIGMFDQFEINMEKLL